MSVFGRVTIAVNGQELHSKPGASLNPGGPAGAAINSDQGFVGVAKSNDSYNATITATIVYTDLQQYEGIRAFAGDATFTTDGGDSWVVRNAAIEAPPALTGAADGGTFEVTIIGDRAKPLG